MNKSISLILNFEFKLFLAKKYKIFIYYGKTNV